MSVLAGANGIRSAEDSSARAGHGDANGTMMDETRRARFVARMVSLNLVALVAAIVFFFLTYGRAASLTVLSEPALIIPPGTSGKFQLSIQNLRKKGNPINFQLSAGGMPDGWDAKLSIDHAVLDLIPRGGLVSLEKEIFPQLLPRPVAFSLFTLVVNMPPTWVCFRVFRSGLREPLEASPVS